MGILGSGEFVEQVINEADALIKSRLSPQHHQSEILEIVSRICKKEEININELRSGSRRRPVAASRLRITQKLVEELGESLAETVRQLGVSTSAISLSLKRASQI